MKKIILFPLILILGYNYSINSMDNIDEIDVSKFYENMSLDLSSAKNKGIDISQFDKFRIHGQKLSNLITNLNLSNNNINTLPESFGNLPKLTNLDLSNNELQRLPKSFGNLSKLTNLDISNNKLEKLPKSFCNLSELSILNISNNNLEKLPKDFGNLSGIFNLNLSKNNLTTLPASFVNLNMINELDVSHNNLISLPPIFETLTNLQDLNASNNKLTNIPECFSEQSDMLYSNLSNLNLANNSLKNLPAWIFNVFLTSLNLSNNQITELPDNIESSNTIENLDLSLNPLIGLPKSIVNLKKLNYLNLFQTTTPILGYILLNGKEGYRLVRNQSNLNLEDINNINSFINQLASEKKLIINPFQVYNSITDIKKYSKVIKAYVKEVLEGLFREESNRKYIKIDIPIDIMKEISKYL